MKKLALNILLLCTILILTACGNTNKNNTAEEENSNVSTPSGEEFTIGVLPAESAIPIILAKEKGYFDEEGITVALKAFASPNDRNVAVQAKELDAVIGDVMTAASFKQNDIDLVITSDISEDFKILASPNSGITDIKGLSGKRISLVPNFILEYIMDQFAAQNGFEYEIVEIPSFSGRAEALLADQIDGVIFTEPQAGMLVSQGAHLLGSSKEAGIKGGALMFTDAMVKEKPEDIKAFYRAYNKAVDYMNEVKAEEYSSILTQYQFPEAITVYLTSLPEAFQYAGSIEKEQFDSIIEWTVSKGMISNAYSFEELTNFNLIEQK